MSACTQNLIDALKTVIDPELGKDLISLKMIRDLNCDEEGRVSLTVVLTTPACPMKDQIESDVRRALMKVRGVKKVQIDMASETTDGHLQKCENSPDTNPHENEELPGPGAKKVKNVIGVSSGKGGVGKSTVSVNLALSLAQSGAKVGLLDADFHGPNIPLMMGLVGQQTGMTRGKKDDGEPIDMILPLENYGVKVVSIAFFIDEDDPVVWRGPMLHNALNQFFHQVEWGELDYLIVDMPPGTGDIQISLIQMARLTGVVHVTTPQNVSAHDVTKGVQLFKAQGIPQLGVIENMSYFISPATGEKTFIFGQGGGKKIAEKFGIPFLGEVPLEMDVRVGGDNGQPVVVANPESTAAKAFNRIAGQLAGAISVSNLTRHDGPACSAGCSDCGQ